MKKTLALLTVLVVGATGVYFYKTFQTKERTRQLAEQAERESAARKAEEEAKRQAAQAAAEAKERAVQARKASAEREMRAAFDKILADPMSVQFRELKFYFDLPVSKIRTAGTGDVDVVCGEYNAKNRMGGYVGFKFFYWDSQSRGLFETTSDPTLAQIMEDLARKTCDRLSREASTKS